MAEGRTRKRASALLGRMRSREEIAGGNDGDALALYDRIKAALVKIARDGQVRTIVCRPGNIAKPRAEGV